ncbi:ThiF family adenylyltransferase [Methylophilus flavus]|uniref:ThiF family adenylyltransferase n=1 Tax=Methylophilus flavus TaxID=640084 RepID=A0ABW3PDM9_9PROT
MFQKLVSHNPDIAKLVERGYAVSFDNGYMVVRDIPYIDNAASLRIGAFVTKMVLIDETKVTQEDHQIFFAGSHPHQLDGQPIANLGGGAVTLSLGEACHDVVVERSFSNKPRGADGVLIPFADFYEKLESYTRVISGPAIEKFEANPYTFKSNTSSSEESVFKFQDTLTSRAEILDLSSKLKDEVIGIIGLGGTGSYLLDFLIKMPVKEIKGFDLDKYHVHNAFRSPGKVETDEFGKSKSEVYEGRYKNFRHGLTLIPKFIDETCIEDVKGLTFAFVCVDKGSSRRKIFDLLIKVGIPFIDVGMGLNRRDVGLNGMARVTYFPPDKAQEMLNYQLAEMSDRPDDLYRTNIQIAELNAINASLAIIKYKQVKNFYTQSKPYLHILFGLEDLKINSLDKFSED